jgi:nucleoside-diphosphate-sugar epimerase
MKVLLTGGSGDLGTMASPALEQLGHSITNLDLKPGPHPVAKFIQGSILDRKLLDQVVPEVDCVVHIAALHGIHEAKGGSSKHQFWDINVTGTFNLLEAAAQAHIGRFVFVSSSSANNPKSFYGHSKVLAEETCKSFTVMHPDLSVIRLRPRAFIPHWNRDVYKTFADWAKWFWGGAVHINDVNQALVKSVQLLAKEKVNDCPMLIVDGKHDYTLPELRDWDAKGPGSTFKARYGQHYHDLAVRNGLDPAQKPSVLDISETTKRIGYVPTYSLENLLQELEAQG